LKPCVVVDNKISYDTTIKIPSNNAKVPSNNAQVPSNNAQVPSNNANVAHEKICRFCFNVFHNKWNLNKHEKTCKMKDDPCRLLEIEMGIQHNMSDDLICYYCNKALFRADSLTRHLPKCKQRELYHQQLLKQKEEKTINLIINNSNNCNNTTNITNNNLSIHFHENTIPFGNKRLTDHIKVEKLLEMMRASYKQYEPGQDYEVAGELLLRLEEYLQEIPENRNYRIDDKSTIWTVKTESGFKYIDKDKCINSIIKENAGILCTKQEEIGNSNEKVFKNKTMIEAFDHQKQFEKKGIYHNIYGQRKLDKIKTGMLLVNKNVCDF